MQLQRDDILSVLSSLLRAELQALREDGDALDTVRWADTPLGRGGLEADSIERLALATAVNTLFQLHESGLEDYLLSHRTLGEWAELIAFAQGRGSSGLTFATSGSSGAPKPCAHSWESLAQEVEALAGLFAGRRRILAPLPVHHIYGFLFGVLLPRRLDCEVLRGDAALAALHRGLQPGDLVVAFPLRWAYLERALPAFADDVLGVTSTAPCEPELIARLCARNLRAMFEIYGSSETAGIGYRTDPAAGYRLFSYWRRTDEQQPRLQRRLADGEWSAPLEPMDRLEWAGPDLLRPVGRRDGAIQVGGVNVFVPRVEAYLAAHPAVAQCRVRLTAAGAASRLKAFVVPRDRDLDQGELREALAAWCRRGLAVAEQPMGFAFGGELPRNELGKLADW